MAPPYPEPVESTLSHPTIRWKFIAVLLFHLCKYLKTCLIPQVIKHNFVCSWSHTQSHDLPDGCALQYHRAPTTCQLCSIHQPSTTPTTYWMRCILTRHHNKFPIMPLLLRLLRTDSCSPFWNFPLTRTLLMLPLRNMATLTALNFFLLLLASMYLVLYMELKTLETAYNKTTRDFCGLWRTSYNYLFCEIKSIFSFNVSTVFTYSIIH